MEIAKCKLCGTELPSFIGNPYMCRWCEGSCERQYPDNRGYGMLIAT